MVSEYVMQVYWGLGPHPTQSLVLNGSYTLQLSQLIFQGKTSVFTSSVLLKEFTVVSIPAQTKTNKYTDILDKIYYEVYWF